MAFKGGPLIFMPSLSKAAFNSAWCSSKLPSDAKPEYEMTAKYSSGRSIILTLLSSGSGAFFWILFSISFNQDRMTHWLVECWTKLNVYYKLILMYQQSLQNVFRVFDEHVPIMISEPEYRFYRSRRAFSKDAWIEYRFAKIRFDTHTHTRERSFE